MGMEAQLMGVGAYSQSLSGKLEYKNGRYDECPEGTLITDVLYQCSSNNESHQLAEALGIDDPFNPSQWLVDPKKIDWPVLEGWCAEDEEMTSIPETIRTMLSLKWMLFYRPNY